MKRTLLLFCSFTLLATAYLTLSAIILRPPRLNATAWLLMAALFTAQSVMTLLMLGRAVRGEPARRVLLAGGVALALVGAGWVRATVSGPHFEGYALVLGSWVAVQGSLTIGHLMVRLKPG